jgi:hypothetical protein
MEKKRKFEMIILILMRKPVARQLNIMQKHLLEALFLINQPLKVISAKTILLAKFILTM